MTTVQTFDISDGDAGIAQTVAHMARLIREGMAVPMVRAQAAAIVADLDPDDSEGQCYAIREWLAQHTVFVRDPLGVELLRSPEQQLRTIAAQGVARGDCDCVALLAGALGGAIGLHVLIVTVAFLDNSVTTPQYSHVWCSLSGQGGDWIEMDVTRPMQNIPTNKIARSKTYPVG